MTEMATSALEAPGSIRPTLWRRARDTFLAPGRLFRGFDASPPWLDALGLATVIAAVAVAAEPADYFLNQMENPVDRRGVPVEITSPPEQIVLWGRAMAMLSAIVGHPLLAFGSAGLLMLMFAVIGRSGGTYRQYLGVASHGLLILSAGMLLTNVVRLLADAPSLLPTLGALAALPDTGLVAGTLHGVNVFTLWTLAVLGIGAASIARGVTTASATALLWGGYLLLAVTGAILFGA